MAPSPDPDTTNTSSSLAVDGLAPVLWLPYVAPFATFLLLTAVESRFSRSQYPFVYIARMVLVTGVLLFFARQWRSEIYGDGKSIAIGVAVGLLGLVLWLGVDAITPSLPQIFGTRTAFNPFVEIPNVGIRILFLLVRLFGLAVIVPIIEEVFWRSFLLRAVTDPERWQTLSIGVFSPIAFLVVAALFGIAHPAYLAGTVFAILMAGLLRSTKSLLSCIVAHGITNLTLGIYVLVSGNWKYW